MLEDEKGPGEPNPEEDLPDYEEELSPSIRIPEAPSPPSTADVDAPAGLQRKFWVLVLVFNGALLGVSLGAMYVGFRGDWTLGSRLLAGGLVCFGYGVFRLRTWDLPTGDGSRDTTGDGDRDPSDDDND
ncbi:DUF7322 domain-containing protein [Haloarchaeobius salinus]|uniref:DUF7322 domain-containing protein n=1 Tax=Haloarchaeobius salinus TaxID=1198298 RepID=UPI00210BA6AD|nr:hypothetical protein [Haloarchaeobius salinus]